MINKKISKPGVIVIDGHVQGLALTRSFGEQGIPVFVVDRNKQAVSKYSKYCQKFFQSPDYLDTHFADFLIKLAQEEGIKDWLLLPCDDHIVFSISKRKKDLSEYYKLITIDFDKLLNIIDKGKLNYIAKKIGVNTIPTFYPKSNIIDEKDLTSLRYPILIKGLEGQTFYKKAKKKAIEVNSLEEAKKQFMALLKKMPPNEIMLQEKIPLGALNKVVSFTAFCINGEVKTYWMGQKLREHPIDFGTATYTESVFIKDLLEQSTPLLKELKYEGVCEIEYLYDPRDKKYYLIEINPRTWLWVGLAKDCGVNYPILIYNYLNGINQNYPQNYIQGKKWMNLWTDTFFSLKYILKGRIKMSVYLSSLIKNKTFALLSIKDIKPFFAMGGLLFYVNKRR